MMDYLDFNYRIVVSINVTKLIDKKSAKNISRYSVLKLIFFYCTEHKIQQAYFMHTTADTI